MLPIVIAGLVATGIGLYNHQSVEKGTIALSNIEALLSPELDTSYSRKAKNCEFNVGANASVTFLGLGLLKADANGIISVPEQVTCVANGNETCSPIECADLLKLMIRDEEKE